MALQQVIAELFGEAGDLLIVLKQENYTPAGTVMELEIIKLIHPWDPPYETVQEVNTDSHRILCFDLDEFRFEDAIARVNRIHQFERGDEVVIIPCTMLLTALESVLSPGQIEQALDAGTVLYERPPNSSNVSTLSILLDLEREINSESTVEFDSEKRSGRDLKYKPLPYRETEINEADLELFANPIAEIDENSFKRLLDRIHMRDTSWEKDD